MKDVQGSQSISHVLEVAQDPSIVKAFGYAQYRHGHLQVESGALNNLNLQTFITTALIDGSY